MSAATSRNASAAPWVLATWRSVSAPIVVCVCMTIRSSGVSLPGLSRMWSGRPVLRVLHGQRGMNATLKRDDAQGLDEKIIGAGRQHLGQLVAGRGAGKHDDLLVRDRGRLAELAGELDSRHPRHADIGQDQI